MGAVLLRLLTVAVFSLSASSVTQAEDLRPPTGPVVLTVAGKVSATNRGAFDPFDDAFTNYHERTFDAAAAFDLGMLEGLGLHKVTLQAPDWPRPQVLEGPWLRDVLAAAGAMGDEITTVALDGFAVILSAEDLAAQDWLLAIKRDGAYLGIGERGPAWLVYAPKDGSAPTADDEARWPWAVFFIESQ